jgi:ABC-type lipoprotein export system ATPase subunit
MKKKLVNNNEEESKGDTKTITVFGEGGKGKSTLLNILKHGPDSTNWTFKSDDGGEAVTKEI